MKRLCLLIGLAVLRLSTTAQSPVTTDTTKLAHKPADPAKRAVNQLTLLQDKLDLNADQVGKVHLALLDEYIALDSLQDNLPSDHKVENQARRDIVQNADVRIYAALNEDQRMHFMVWKQEERIKALARRASRADSLNNAAHRPDSTISMH